MPEIGPSGLEGGVALTRHPYPYRLREPAPLEARRLAPFAAHTECHALPTQ